jgi:6-phosphogluconolactonase
VPQLNVTRLTFTPKLINAGRDVVILVAGANKAERLAEVLDGPVDVDRLPSQIVRPSAGGPTWLVDRAAAGSLAKRPE